MADPDDKWKVLIETRGEGGFAVIAPSYGKVHPTGKPYQLLQGGVEQIITITSEERRTLWQLAKTYDQSPKQEARQATATKSASGQGRPGDPRLSDASRRR